MRLLMLFGTEVIDKISMDSRKAHSLDYIAYLQQELINRNEELLEQSADLPQFAIEKVSCKLGFKSILAVHRIP